MVLCDVEEGGVVMVVRKVRLKTWQANWGLSTSQGL